MWSHIRTEEKAKKRKSSHQRTDLFLQNLMHAVELSTTFYSQHGPDPNPPERFQSVPDKLNGFSYMTEYKKWIKEKGFDFAEVVMTGTKRIDKLEQRIQSENWLQSDYISYHLGFCTPLAIIPYAL